MVSSTLHNTELHACMLSCFSHVQLFVTLWTVAHQAPLSLEFSRQEHWSGLPLPPPGALPNLGKEPRPLLSPALVGGFFATSATWEAQLHPKSPSIIFMSVLQYCLMLNY